jgi:hypothetical protein
MSRLEQSPSGDGSLEHREYLTVQADLIPIALREFPRPQWVCWRKVFRGEGKKPDKRPINPKTLGNAGPTHRIFNTAPLMILVTLME